MMFVLKMFVLKIVGSRFSSSLILVAPFVDSLTLATIYKIAGMIPILSPVAQYSVLFSLLSTHIRDPWLTKTRIANYVRRSEEILHPYRVTLIHAEDDFNVPWYHTPMLFEQVVNAVSENKVEPSLANAWRTKPGQDIEAAGRVAQLRTDNGGVVSVFILKYGLHDVIMRTSIVTLVATDIFAAGDDVNIVTRKT